MSKALQRFAKIALLASKADRQWSVVSRQTKVIE